MKKLTFLFYNERKGVNSQVSAILQCINSEVNCSTQKALIIL